MYGHRQPSLGIATIQEQPKPVFNRQPSWPVCDGRRPGSGRNAARPAGQRVHYGTYTEPQYYQYRGSRYCYYGDGDQAWNGNGWYTCGQYRDPGIGYGGPLYWNNWYY